MPLVEFEVEVDGSDLRALKMAFLKSMDPSALAGHLLATVGLPIATYVGYLSSSGGTRWLIAVLVVAAAIGGAWRNRCIWSRYLANANGGVFRLAGDALSFETPSESVTVARSAVATSRRAQRTFVVRAPNRGWVIPDASFDSSDELSTFLKWCAIPGTERD